MKIVRSRTKTNTGFTMIEVLVVITIIVILTAIAGSVIGNVISTAKVVSTRATIKHLHEVVRKRMDGFTRHRHDLAKGTSLSRAAISIERKKDFKDHFPQYIDHEKGETPLTAADTAEIFYDFIVNGETFGTDTEDTDQGPLSSAIGDTDNDGRKEFVDAWGNPLRFYRWPTRLVQKAMSGNSDDVTAAKSLITSLPPNLNSDPDDPLGLLSELDNINFHDPKTFHVPLIVSAGPDGELGLYEPLQDSTTFGHLANWFVPDPTVPAEVKKHKAIIEAIYDNITNHNQTAGSN